MSKGIFITGTGTDVGKTYAAALLLKKMREAVNAGYYKAALSGAEVIDGKRTAGDAYRVCKTAGIDGDPNDYVSYIYDEAVSPHLAARNEGNPVSLDKVKQDFVHICDEYEQVVVEGSGGIVCPIRYDSEKIMLIDVIKALKLDVIIVSETRLGSINSAVLTYEYAVNHGIGVRGFILNNYNPDDEMQRDNKLMIEQLTGAEILGIVKENADEIELFCGIDNLIK